jgi:hypothetical protein
VFDIRQCTALKIPVHKIQFCFMIWVTVVLYRCKYSTSIAFCGDDTDATIYCISCTKILFGDIPYIALVFPDFPQVACVYYVLLHHLKLNLLLKTFHVFVNCLPVWNISIRIFCPHLWPFLYGLYYTHISYKTTYLNTHNCLFLFIYWFNTVWRSLWLSDICSFTSTTFVNFNSHFTVCFSRFNSLAQNI